MGYNKNNNNNTYYYYYYYYHYYHHQSFMELGHLLTRSGLTYPEVSLTVYHDFFCQLGNIVSLLLLLLLLLLLILLLLLLLLLTAVGLSPGDSGCFTCTQI